MDRKTSTAFLTLFAIGAVCGASLVLNAIYLTLGGAQADPMVLALGLVAGVLLLAGMGRAAFSAGYEGWQGIVTNTARSSLTD
ncbi:hypothetical protein ABQZ63_021715 (plasmid) [Xanthomonas perforans]|uniref:hypothetical protein n=1 Tax=Xanthomonas perforans TaxID=442694 RepID=UPI0032E87F84